MVLIIDSNFKGATWNLAYINFFTEELTLHVNTKAP